MRTRTSARTTASPRSRLIGVGGTGWCASGTQPTAAALTNGNHAATDAMPPAGTDQTDHPPAAAELCQQQQRGTCSDRHAYS